MLVQVLSVAAWGLKNDDIITVKGVHVPILKPSRQHLLQVRTGAWRSEAPPDAFKKLPVEHMELSQTDPTATQSKTTSSSTSHASPKVSREAGETVAEVAEAPTTAVPTKVKLADALGARNRASRWEK